MLNYLNNNLVLINEYQNLYFQEINIEKIIERFRTGEIIKHNGFDYGRFRVFIDSCLLLLNKEKLNDYYKNGGAPLVDFSPNMYLNEASLEQWIQMIKKQSILY